MAFDPRGPSPIQSLPDSTWLTYRQLSAIGAVVATWSWLELQMESALEKLVQSPSHLSQALTIDLGPDNRIKAIKRLTATWRAAMQGKNEQLFDEIEDWAKWISKNKTERNIVAHYIWFRANDAEMFGFKYHTQPKSGATPTAAKTVTEIEDFSDEIGKRVVQGNVIVSKLREFPDWPEKWNA